MLNITSRDHQCAQIRFDIQFVYVASQKRAMQAVMFQFFSVPQTACVYLVYNIRLRDETNISL